ncbi:hypothetical protein LshimejAT787_0900490 [Lyophyllum shimeji]|uniref:Uncharacterized protein n=1 Tax=Lyophyllum shimeji TaxID=47721 RepID=A0A9P3PSM1_LYOSH|nr:hypothetical protein LshimejAT787_0900490 [Lyophyllum shimeji]
MQNSLEITIDDISPLVDFQPWEAWAHTNSSTDPIGSQYYAETFTRTQQVGATASFTFKGTSVTIYGGKGAQHGNYTVTIDGDTSTASGFSPTAQYQAILATVDGLEYMTHTRTLTNTQFTFLDIDFITWTSSVSSSKSGPISKRLADDADEEFKYIPTSVWSNKPAGLNRFFSSTWHTTSSSGALVHYKFTVSPLTETQSRCAVTQNFAGLRLQLDGQSPKSYQGRKATYAPQTLLFHASDLGHGNHTVVITNSEDAVLEVDSAMLYRVDSYRSSPTALMHPDPTGAGDNTGSPSCYLRCRIRRFGHRCPCNSPLRRRRPNVSSSASTLVAEDGSNASTSRRGSRSKRRSRQDRGSAIGKPNEVPPPVPPLPPQLPHIRPVGHLIPSESVSDLLELPTTTAVQMNDSVAPPVSATSLANGQRASSPSEPSAGIPEAPGSNENTATAGPSPTLDKSRTSEVIGTTEAILLHDSSGEAGAVTQVPTPLVVPPPAASTSSSGRGLASLPEKLTRASGSVDAPTSQSSPLETTSTVSLSRNMRKAEIGTSGLGSLPLFRSRRHLDVDNA